MFEPSSRLQGRSFLWVFIVFVALFVAGAFYGKSLGLSAKFARYLIVGAALVPVVVQVVTGYGFDPAWRATFSRTKHAATYWTSLSMSLALVCWFAYLLFWY